MSVKVRWHLPSGDRNGLDWLTEDLWTDDGVLPSVVAVVALTPRNRVENLNDDSNPHTVVLDIAWIEALTEIDAEACRSLADTAYERRTGKAPLPFGSVLDVNPDELPEPPMGEWMDRGEE